MQRFDNFTSHDTNPTQEICKGFFDRFIYAVFMRNLIEFDDIFVNGIAQSKSIVYSSIQETLLAHTPYVWKYDFMNLARDRASHNDKLKLHKPKWRFMDFWCMRDRADFEALFSSEGILADSDENEIKDAVAQMCAIFDKVESAKAKGDKIRVVFLPSPHATDKVANCSAKTHKIMEDLLVDFLLNHFIITAFYATLQNDKNCNGESKPYFALGAIMLGLES